MCIRQLIHSIFSLNSNDNNALDVSYMWKESPCKTIHAMNAAVEIEGFEGTQHLAMIADTSRRILYVPNDTCGKLLATIKIIAHEHHVLVHILALNASR